MNLPPYGLETRVLSSEPLSFIRRVNRSRIAERRKYKTNMKINTLLSAAALALVVLSTGCSTVMCGKNQTVPVTSRPPGADVTVFDKYNDVIFKGVTPCDVTLARGDSDSETGASCYKITVVKPGYESVEVDLVGKVNRAYLANVMNAGIGMVTVDPYTGAKWTLVPMEINPHLVMTGQ